MLEIINEKAITFCNDYMDITWEINATTSDVQDYSFYVLRSESPAGPWDVLTGPMIDLYYFRDGSIPSLNPNRLIYYQVKVQNNKDPEQVGYSKVFSRKGKPDAIAREIMRLRNVLLKEFVGVTSWLFPIRTFGQRCTACWDVRLSKRTQSNCNLCWGTGYSGGYHYPIQFICRVQDPPEYSERVSAQEHRATHFFTVHMNASPEVKPTDIIIDHLNRRLRVLSIRKSTKLGVTVSQIVRCVQVEKGAIEYKMPLNVPNDVKLVPERNFSNPSDESHSPDVSDILDFYGYK